ncbi:MAG: SH3 domain-containing protein [Firmicutes bacterium]|nr:SH3 domain-containing protein [Bacillota bacterium]
MSQSVIVILLSLMLFISNLFGGPSDIAAPKGQLPNQEQTYTVTGQIRKSPATLYESPSTDSKRIATGQPNTSVSILAESGDWYKVQLPNGTTGWVRKIMVNTSGSTGGTGLLTKEVYGYFVQNANLPSQPSLAANYNKMTGIAPWAFSVDAEGNVHKQMNPQALADTLAFAGQRKLKTLALISNYDKATESFSGKIAHELLRSAANRKRAVENIYKTAVDWGLSGINLDFEYVYPSDREYYSQFLRELSSRLRPAGIMVTVAIPAKTYDDPSSSWSGAFDYKAIGQAVDRVMLMAYDQHYAGGPPGPIASADWVDRVLKFAVSQIPKEKVILGIAGYGYSWRAPGSAHSVTYQRAVELAAKGSGVRWDANHKAPYATYEGREMWFENAASISYKLELVQKYDIQGIALWRLGQEDPQMWQLVASKF